MFKANSQLELNPADWIWGESPLGKDILLNAELIDWKTFFLLPLGLMTGGVVSN